MSPTVHDAPPEDWWHRYDHEGWDRLGPDDYDQGPTDHDRALEESASASPVNPEDG